MILTVIRDIYDIYWAFPTSIIAKVEGKTIFIKEGSRVFIGTASNESEKDHSIVGRAVFNTIKSIYKYKSPSPSIPRPTNPTHKEKSEEDVKYVYHYNDNQIYSAMYIKDNLMIGQSNRKEINQTSTIEVKEIVFSTEN
ncbi:hypothetical protein C2W62_18320 [Candidatus Entotheonella serta]|nr:hypothetical protein C2W62_18320 [Candidatus Entotheonella serta]